MKTYNFTRKINPKRFFPDMQYESVEFYVEGCASPQEAQQEVEQWVKDWINQKVSEQKALAEKEEPFEGDEFSAKKGKMSLAEQN